MTPDARRALLAMAVFGLCDGMLSIVGCILTARSQPHLVPWLATVGGIGAGLSMSLGRYLAEDNDDPIATHAMLGVATLVGTVLPSLPYLALHGTSAISVTGAVCLALSSVVAKLRSGGSWKRALFVLGLFAAVFAVTLVCALLAPTGGA